MVSFFACRVRRPSPPIYSIEVEGQGGITSGFLVNYTGGKYPGSGSDRNEVIYGARLRSDVMLPDDSWYVSVLWPFSASGPGEIQSNSLGELGVL